MSFRGNRSGPYGSASSGGGGFAASQYKSPTDFAQLFFERMHDLDQPALVRCVEMSGPDWKQKRGLSSAIKASTVTQLSRTTQNALEAYRFHQGSKMADVFDLNSESGESTAKQQQEVKQSLANFVVSYLLMLREYTSFETECGGYGGGNMARDTLQKSLDHCMHCLREWGTLYIATADAYENHIWMIPCYQYLLAWARETAIALEDHFCVEGNATVNGLVDCLRKIFGDMVREKQKRAGFLTLTTELVRCYLWTYQTAGAQQVLKSVMQMSQGGSQPGFPTVGVPKSVAVSLAYYWGVILVQSNNYAEAEAKISWGYDRLAEETNAKKSMMGGAGISSLNHSEHRKQFLCYLVPLRIRKGVLPSEELLRKYQLEDIFGKIVQSIVDGDLDAFEAEEQRQRTIFVRHGTMNLWAAVKILVVRQLIRKIVLAYTAATPADAANSWKIDAAVVIASVVRTCPQYADVEVEQMLAQLMATGAMKGYLTLSHGKLVVPKTGAWPPVEKIFDEAGY